MSQRLRTLTTLTLITSILWSGVWLRAAASDPEAVASAVAYLRSHAADDPEWVALALRAAGASAADVPVSAATDGAATDLARRILALAAIGVDPRPLADALEAKVVNGSVNGDSYLNDDTFAVLAFWAAGHSATDEPVPTIISFLRGAQRSDGGWAVTTQSRSDVDSTAAALQALWLVGERGTAIAAGLQFLRSQQQTDAGFPFRKPSASNSASTAWVLSTFGQIGQSRADWQVSGVEPQQLLLTTQQPDGGFSYQPGNTTSTTLLTSYAVLALSGRGFVVARYTPTPPVVDDPPPPPAPEEPSAPPTAPAPSAAPSPPAEPPSPSAEPAPASSSTLPPSTSTIPVSGTVVPPVSPPQVENHSPIIESVSTVRQRRHCRIKGDVTRRGRRLVRRFYLPTTRGYRWVRLHARQGDRWFCSVREARRAGFRLASRR